MDTNQAVHIRSIQFLHGPNVYAYMPVQQAIIDIEAYDYQPRTHWPGRVERLTTWLPGLASHIVSPNRPGGFIVRLTRGTYLAQIVVYLTIELQAIMGLQVTFGRARGIATVSVYRVVVAYQKEIPARRAFEATMGMALALFHNRPCSVAAVRRAYPLAAAFDPIVFAEYVHGDNYWLLVIGNELIAAARLDPAQMTGDGQHSINELVVALNLDPQRRPGQSSGLTRIELDKAADLTLQAQNLMRVSIPADGQVVRVRTNANLSTRGTAIDVTNSVHPVNAASVTGEPESLPIVIVDDEPAILDLLRLVLEGNDFTVLTASNASAALALIQHTPVALVLTDLMMPHSSGLELAQQLRSDSRTKAIPLILMSAALPPNVTDLFDKVLHKPFSIDTVVDMVREFF